MEGVAAPPNRPARLTGLDALRGIAAFCVLARHVAILAGGGFASHAYLAVDFFFMLSGYVMARTYEPMAHPCKFVLGRLRRLWPLIALGMVLGIPAFVWTNHADLLPTVLAMGLLLIPALPFGAIYPLNSPAWSISFELAANLLHAFTFSRLRTAEIALLAAAMFGLTAFVSMSYGTFDLGHEAGSLFAGLPRTLFSYLTGILLFRLWRDRPSVRPPAILTWIAMPALLLYNFDFGVGFDLAFVLLGTPLLLAGGVANNARFGHAIGAMSFPLYATHLPILLAFDHLGWPGGLAVALAVAALLAFVPARLRRMSTQLTLRTSTPAID